VIWPVALYKSKNRMRYSALNLCAWN